MKSGGNNSHWTDLSSEKVNNFKGMLNNPYRHQLFTIVPPMHHHGVCQSFHDGALKNTNMNIEV